MRHAVDVDVPGPLAGLRLVERDRAVERLERVLDRVLGADARRALATESVHVGAVADAPVEALVPHRLGRLPLLHETRRVAGVWSDESAQLVDARISVRRRPAVAGDDARIAVGLQQVERLL